MWTGESCEGPQHLEGDLRDGRSLLDSDGIVDRFYVMEWLSVSNTVALPFVILVLCDVLFREHLPIKQ